MNPSHRKCCSTTKISRSSQPARARGGADRVGGLESEQRLVAVDDVERREALRKMGFEGFGPKLDGSCSCVRGSRFPGGPPRRYERFRRLQPANELLHGVRLHLLQ